MSKLKVTKPEKFRVRLANCGTDTCWANYEKMESEDALALATKVCLILTDNFIGKKAQALFRYHLGCGLLNSVSIKNNKQLIKDIKNAEKFLGKWILKKEKNGK